MKSLILIIILLTSCAQLSWSPQINRYPSALTGEGVVGVLGDLEGNIARFDDYIKGSDILFYNDEGEVDLRPGKKFLFQGDVMDRGPGSIRIMKALIQLKDKYPNDITIILGNRDINKLKIISLVKEHENGPIPQLIFKWYKALLKNQYKVKFSDNISFSNFQELAAPYDNPVNRLKVFLAGMNAPQAFEFRREELTILKPSQAPFTDDMVFKSFMDDFKKEGLLHRYLIRGQLGKVIDGNLFVHGAVTPDNYGYVPGKTRRINDAIKWLDELNIWAKEEINAWWSDPFAGQALLNYHAPRLGRISNTSSVIYARFSDGTGNAQAPTRRLIKKLNNSGIHRVVVGHTPAGDYVSLVKSPGLEIVLTDNSFSTMQSASQVTISGEQVVIQSKTPDGEPVWVQSNYNYLDTPFGLKTHKGQRVIGYLPKTNEYLTLKVKGSGRRFTPVYGRLKGAEIGKEGLLQLLVQEGAIDCEALIKNLFRQGQRAN